MCDKCDVIGKMAEEWIATPDNEIDDRVYWFHVAGRRIQRVLNAPSGADWYRDNMASTEVRYPDGTVKLFPHDGWEQRLLEWLGKND